MEDRLRHHPLWVTLPGPERRRIERAIESEDRICMAAYDRTAAIDHVVVLMFENRSFDNLLGRLYEPGEVASFEGVLGKELSNPIPSWAEHGADARWSSTASPGT